MSRITYLRYQSRGSSKQIASNGFEIISQVFRARSTSFSRKTRFVTNVVSFYRYSKLKTCVSRTFYVKGDVGVGSIPKWPRRLTEAAARVAQMEKGSDAFKADSERWMRRVAHYKNSLNLKLGTVAVRTVMGYECCSSN